MRFVVITHVLHKYHEGRYFAYGPYVREMNIWFKNVDEVIVVAPLEHGTPDPIDLPYEHERIRFEAVPAFSFTTLPNVLRSLWHLPGVLFRIGSSMRRADHIHLRCPGNMGLLGCVVQVAFPNKPKTAKYAGNWDPKSRQPWSYRLQKWLLRNTWLTHNMQALVYGQWSDATRNIRPFFTASYSETEALPTPVRPLDRAQPVRLLFVGGLHAGKRPLLAVKVVKKLSERGVPVRLDVYGDGRERAKLEEFIGQNGLGEKVFLHGNVEAAIVKEAYARSHFLIFLSKSEGWPKVVAEAMFWGCLPLTSPVSCVPEMVGNGERGDLLPADSDAIAERILWYIRHPEEYILKAEKAMSWSHRYTLERFETEIQKLLRPRSA